MLIPEELHTLNCSLAPSASGGAGGERSDRKCVGGVVEQRMCQLVPLPQAW